MFPKKSATRILPSDVGALAVGPVPSRTATGRPLTNVVTRNPAARPRSEEHTSELQSQSNLVCRLLLEKKKNITLPDTLAIPPQMIKFLSMLIITSVRPTFIQTFLTLTRLTLPYTDTTATMLGVNTLDD